MSLSYSSKKKKKQVFFFFFLDFLLKILQLFSPGYSFLFSLVVKSISHIFFFFFLF
ncbi:hypothetical protein H8356DRAFT_1728181, partial [Neocallimastix lanati (nom. inval.)]